jgi:hypothetical protein
MSEKETIECGSSIIISSKNEFKYIVIPNYVLELPILKKLNSNNLDI